MKLKVCIHAKYDDYEKQHDFSVWAHNMNGTSGYHMVEEREIDFDAPPRDVLVNGTIAAYRAEQQRVRAEAEQKSQRIQRAIDELLAIEYKADEPF